MKTKALTVLAAGTLAWALASAAAAGDLYVIGNPAVSLSEEEIRDAWLGDKQMAGGTRLVPLDNAAQQRDFLERVLKVEPGKYNAIWVKKGFRDGINPPPVKTSDAEVVAAVKANPGAIGYVSSPPKDVKVLAKY